VNLAARHASYKTTDAQPDSIDGKFKSDRTDKVNQNADPFFCDVKNDTSNILRANPVYRRSERMSRATPQ
jgi:hypothetical protein